MKRLEIIRGDDEAIEISIMENGVSLIKNNAKFILTVKKNLSDADDDAVFKDIYPVTADTNLFVIDLSNTETELPLDVYEYCDITWVDENGKVKTIYRDSFSVLWDSTRSNI